MTKSKKSYTTVSRGGTRISNESPGRRALLFNEVNAVSNNKNVFDLSHGHSTSGQMGHLIPLNVIKCVPGDIHKIGHSPFMRMAPMTSPPMTQVNCSIHNWFIPTRLLWDGFEDYIIGKAGAPAMPYITLDTGLTAAEKRFLDYMGIPPIGGAGQTTSVNINALPLAAYQYLYNEKYRDQNLITEVVYKCVDGDNSANGALTILRKVAWEHDLFTSALPTAAFGADVEIPLGDIVLDTLIPASDKGRFTDASGSYTNAGLLDWNSTFADEIRAGGGANELIYDPNGTLVTTPTTIKELRQALKKQEFLELLARGGKRYYEVMERFWNIETSDDRFQQPEYISGIKTPVMISEVLSTAATTDTGSSGRPLGDMGGHGISVGHSEGKSFFCEEYGYIISVMFVTPKSGYSQGIPKHFLELDHYDYGNWPQFEHIGEQELMLQELYAYTAGATNVFGYVPRNAHMKFMPDRISQDMRDPAKLEHWTMNRTFTSAPTLNQAFIEVDPQDDAITRVFVVDDGSDYLYFDIWNQIRSTRPFSVFGNPQL